MTGRTPRALIVAVVVALLVAAGALGGAYLLRLRAAARSPTTPGNSGKPAPTGQSECLKVPCRLLGTSAVGGTAIRLAADAGGFSARLLIGPVPAP